MEILWPEYSSTRNRCFQEGSEPMADAQIFEPIPYRSAIRDGCSHVLVLRTRPDGINVTKKLNLIERLILKRFFRRKLNLKGIESWMVNQVSEIE